MKLPPEEMVWDFGPAINLLTALSLPNLEAKPPSLPTHTIASEDPARQFDLGDFSSIWDYLGRPRVINSDDVANLTSLEENGPLITELDEEILNKGVRWRDELDGADLEDNVEPTSELYTASLRTQKRAARRARAKERATTPKTGFLTGTDTGTDVESGEDLELVRRSPDRRAVIASILGRPIKPKREATSPPTSPSPPKSDLRGAKKEWPVSNPFHWPMTASLSTSHKLRINPRDGLSPRARKAALISALVTKFPSEKKYLINPGLIEPAFLPLNVSKIGVHVFVDISNITIGFHDCLKIARDISRESRVRRVPLSFHNFSLVLERGRPAAKRVLVGSDRFPAIQQAKSIGYETNILERVHKAKEATPRQKKFRPGGASSGMETSGSETNAQAPLEKWVEQAVDEILHLKILESLVDADKPGTIVLATGDAAEAEYSGGFMRMVERALEKGWMVELVSFRLNTSSAYKRREFRLRWGQMFKWVQLDDFVEQLIDAEEW